MATATIRSRTAPTSPLMAADTLAKGMGKSMDRDMDSSAHPDMALEATDPGGTDLVVDIPGRDRVDIVLGAMALEDTTTSVAGVFDMAGLGCGYLDGQVQLSWPVTLHCILVR